MMPRIAFTLAAALACAAAVPAFAQSHRLEAAWEAALGEETPMLAPERISEINVIAYHGAVARLCDGFAIDIDKLGAASNEMVAAALEGVPEDEMVARHSQLLIALGTVHGLFLAEGSLHQEEFCANAAETRADPEFTEYWRQN